jgi:hypothetical protein
VNLPRHIKQRDRKAHASREEGRERDERGNTVAVLVEEAEGLLELGDLVVGELVRHGDTGEGSDGEREGNGQRGEARMEEEVERGCHAHEGGGNEKTDPVAAQTDRSRAALSCSLLPYTLPHAVSFLFSRWENWFKLGRESMDPTCQ